LIAVIKIRTLWRKQTILMREREGSIRRMVYWEGGVLSFLIEGKKKTQQRGGGKGKKERWPGGMKCTEITGGRPE